MKMLRGIEEEANTGDVQDGKSTFTAAQNATSKSHASLCDSRCGRKTDKSYRPRSSYFSVGREFYDDGYSELDDEATIEDRMDFSTLKVRGRDQELLRLHEIYSFVHRGCRRETKVAIIKGLSGTGKSTLVKRFVEELEEQRNSTGSVRVPLFLHGKYDELVGTDPFSGIVEAFDRFANDLVSGKKEELERIRNAVHDQLGPEANTLVTIIPSLNAIMSNKGFPKGSKENARNKLKYVFQRFVSAISTETRPVIMFLDDLQWCDSASLELIQTLLMDADLQHFMFIGAYRKDEVQFDAELHSFLQMIDANQRLEQIDIGNLSKNELNLVVRDALQQENEDECMSLTEAIFNKTKGNIFHSIQVLQELQRKEILMFSRVTFQWEWQLNGVNLDDILSDDIIQAITDKISNCSKDLQRVLVLVAHTRFSIDVDTLQKLTDLNGPMIPSAGLLKILDEAVVDGILANSMGSRVYNFSHDRIQQAACTMVPPGKSRDDLLLNLGLRLYEMGLSQSSDDWMIFIAADHLNASPLPVNGENPMFLIQVNLEAGDRAASISAYETASKYLDMARRLLMRFNKPWEVEYETTLRVYRATAEVELCQGHFSLGKEVGQQVLENATSLEDKLPTQVAICRAVGREERHMEAFNMSVRILRTLRSLPQRNGGMKINLVKDFLYVKRCFARQSDSEILNKPLMVDQKLQTIMELLSVAAYHAYYCGALVDFLAMILRMLRISLTEGFCTHSGVAMMGYCLFCNSMNDMDGAHRFFRLARDILTITEARELECLQIYVVSHFVLSWKVKHEEVIELYEEAHKVGMESGDFENGLLSLTSRYYHGFVAGHSLSVLRLQFLSLIDKIKVYKLESVQVITIEQMLPIPFLQGTAESPFDPKELATFGPVTNLTSKSYRLLYGYLSRLQLAVYFDEDELANYILQRLSKLPDFDIGFCTRSIRLCFSSLAYSTLYRKCRQRTFLRKARRCLKQLKGLCQVKGTNSWHRCMLMEAHLAAAKGKARATIKASYDHAISAAKRSGNEHDAALGAQLAATYFLSTTDDLSNGDIRSNKTLIREYLLQARELYLRWGAAGLVNRLERVHPEFLESAATLFDHGNSQPISVHSSLCPEADSGFAISHIPSMPTAINEKKYRVEVKDDMSVLTEQSAIWKGAH